MLSTRDVTRCSGDNIARLDPICIQNSGFVECTRYGKCILIIFPL